MSEDPIASSPGASAAVRQISAPPSIRALSTLSHIDYADAFVVHLTPVLERTAEQWARTILDDASISMRRTLQSGWSAIGLKLGGASSDGLVLGWEIRRNRPDCVLLGAASRIGMPGELLFKRQQDGLLFATFVQQDNHVARTLWARIEPVHVSLVRRILEGAFRRSSLESAAVPGRHGDEQTPRPKED